LTEDFLTARPKTFLQPGAINGNLWMPSIVEQEKEEHRGVKVADLRWNRAPGVRAKGSLVLLFATRATKDGEQECCTAAKT
jgi:hypothetical protein